MLLSIYVYTERIARQRRASGGQGPHPGPRDPAQGAQGLRWKTPPLPLERAIKSANQPINKKTMLNRGQNNAK